MLLVGSALNGYAIEASDGRIGTVSDLLFDDRTWKMRWLVVDTGGWLTERKILLHPSAVRHVDHERHELPVSLTKAQVEASPDILTDAPVSQRMEANLYDHYGWDPLWSGQYLGAGAMTGILMPLPYESETLRGAGNLQPHPDDGDMHLRSIAAVKGYHIHATDGEIGHVENFLVDDADWGIRYLIVATRNWWPGQHVLMSPYAVQDISWPEHEVRLDVSRDQVKASPAWDPIAIIDQLYEKRLHSHYSWPGYGW